MSVTVNGTTGVSLVDAGVVDTAALASGAVTEVKVDPTLLGTLSKSVLYTVETMAPNSQVEFVNIDPGAYKVTINFAGVSLTAANVAAVSLADSGGYVSGYDFTRVEISTATASTISRPTSGVDSFPVIYNSATDTATGTMVLTRISGNVWLASGVFRLTDLRSSYISGSVSLPIGALESIRISTSSTFDAGSASILVEYI
jgi:hypothetical protein